MIPRPSTQGVVNEAAHDRADDAETDADHQISDRIQSVDQAVEPGQD
jgi:hypothetical protein